MTKTPTTPGSRIAAARKKAGMTQQQLARRSGVGATYIADLEGDRGKNGPTGPTLKKLAKGLGCELLEWRFVFKPTSTRK